MIALCGGLFGRLWVIFPVGNEDFLVTVEEVFIRYKVTLIYLFFLGVETPMFYFNIFFYYNQTTNRYDLNPE